jgi:multiple sugar transport system permease protein
MALRRWFKAGYGSISQFYFGYLLILPAGVLLAIFAYWPILRNFSLSFYTKDLILGTEPQFIGLGNYQHLFHDSRFWHSLRNTLVFSTVSVTFEFLLGLAFALLMNASFRGRGFLRASVLIPWALPPAVMAMGWRWIFNDTYGVMGDIFMRLGISGRPIAWLGEPFWAMVAAVVADIWKTTPFIAIILLAGLQSIPEDLYEAVSLDGANPVHRFTLITLPLLRPYMGLALLFRFIQAYGVFDLIWVLTGGGPGGATQTISLYIYDTVFRYLMLGYGSSLTIVGFFILFLLLIPIFYLIYPNRHD